MWNDSVRNCSSTLFAQQTGLFSLSSQLPAVVMVFSMSHTLTAHRRWSRRFVHIERRRLIRFRPVGRWSVFPDLLAHLLVLAHELLSVAACRPSTGNTFRLPWRGVAVRCVRRWQCSACTGNARVVFVRNACAIACTFGCIAAIRRSVRPESWTFCDANSVDIEIIKGYAHLFTCRWLLWK